jgi:hypothetical protein
MHLANRFLALALSLVIGGGAIAQRRQVSPEVAKACATRLASEIEWHDSLEKTLAEARKQGKLAFYMHMLGKIDGDT